MKKTSKTTATTPAIAASQPSVKAAKKPSAKKAIAPVPAAVAPKVASAPALALRTAARPVTTIVAQIDVGFGNTLFLRGEGPGLSWEAGVPLDCVADDKWSITIANVDKPVVFKLLINDLTWCAGDDFVVQPGSEAVLTPVF